jgi:4-hydroxythreonine-4-phosphate dehydrogenase
VSARAPVPTIAITSGEPAGIGPEICRALARRRWPARLVVLGDRTLIDGRTRRGTRSAELRPLPAYECGTVARRRVELLDVSLRTASHAGRLDPRNAAYVLELLDTAVEGCASGAFQALVTAPVHKGLINDAGIAFSGHTEYFGKRTGVASPVMLLVGGGLRVALATTHVPLARVSEALTRPRLTAVLRVLHADLKRRFGLRAPRILVCGLNPHAGESGHLGREEIEVIEPVLRRLRRAGMKLTGPVPADTAFLPDRLAGFDALLAMYHDQGLPVLKAASFGHAVNVTLGLPIVRTSVDHGTALDIAGQGRADPGSLFAAVSLAIALARPGGARRAAPRARRRRSAP